MPTPALRFHDVTRRLGGRSVLDAVSFDVADGEFAFLLGPSGCGKTSLLRVAAGLDRADAGNIEVFGRVVSNPSIIVPAERREIGMVFQQDALWPHMSARQHLEFTLGSTSRPDRDARVAALLDLVRIAPLADRRPSQLSGGERQRLALARALVHEPRLLLLDEPTRNLDRSLARELRSEFATLLRKRGTTVLYVTHDHEEAFTLADRVMLLENGKIRAAGPPESLYRQPPDAAAANLFGLSSSVRGTVDDRGRVVTPLGSFASELAPGRAFVAIFRPGDVALAADGEPGVVADTRFLGTHRSVVLRFGADAIEIAVDPSTEIVPGSTVRVRARRPPSVFAEASS